MTWIIESLHSAMAIWKSRDADVDQLAILPGASCGGGPTSWGTPKPQQSEILVIMSRRIRPRHI